MTYDKRLRKAVLPTRVLWHKDAHNAQILKSNDIGQALASEYPSCALAAGGSILLDFGRELHGGLQLVCGRTQDKKVAKLRLRFGESASEAMGEPNNDHALHDFTIQLPPMGAQEFGLTGFRFARIDSLETEVEIPLVAARAMTLMHPLEQVGSFRCNDERLNQIWQTGADTVALCMQDFLWDGIKRDRLVWIGDLHPEVAVVSTVWGALEIVPQSLDWVRNSTPLPNWMNDIPSYSLWWIIIQRDWFRAHGNREYLDEQRDYLIPLLSLLIEQIGPDGKVDWRGFQFLDWPSSSQPEAVYAGLIGLLAIALEAGAEICALWGDEAAVGQCKSALALLQKNPPQIPIHNKQASSLLSLSGLYDSALINSTVLAQQPLEGLSTFYGYYILQARAQAGDIQGALEVIRKYWGAMLDLGATSFWEHFDLSWVENAARIDEIPTDQQTDVHRDRGEYCYQGWRHSLCHGWAAGPTAWLSEHILGIQNLDSTKGTVSIVPQLGDLDWAEGTYPTPHGPIKVRHWRKSGKVQTELDLPEGLQLA